MAFLEIIREKNQFPIIFIGSGITQRYFENSPTWEGLLKEIWLELFDEEDFYAKIYELKNEYMMILRFIFIWRTILNWKLIKPFGQESFHFLN